MLYAKLLYVCAHTIAFECWIMLVFHFASGSHTVWYSRGGKTTLPWQCPQRLDQWLMAQPFTMKWSSNYIPTCTAVGTMNALSMVLHFQLQRSGRFRIFPMQHDFKRIRYVLSKSYKVLLSNHWLTTIDSHSSSKLIELLLEPQLMLLMQFLLPLPDLQAPPQSLYRDGFGNCLSW